MLVVSKGCQKYNINHLQIKKARSCSSKNNPVKI